MRRLKIAIIVAAALVVTASLCGSIDLAMSNSFGNNVPHSTGDAASGSEVVYAAASADNSSQLVPTTLTLVTSNTNPAVNKTFTLSGTLTANGTPLSGRQIILLSVDPSGAWTNLGTATTGTNGSYSFTVSEASPGHYGYQTDFPGDTTYSVSYAGSGANVGS